MSFLGRVARGEAGIDVVGRSRLWLVVSGIVIVVSLVGIFGRQFNLGQEFAGGTSLRVASALPDRITVRDVEDALQEFTLEDIKVQIQTAPDPSAPGGEREEILVRSAHIDDQIVFAAVQTRVAEVAGQVGPDGEADVDQVSIEDVGPTWGRQVSTKALQGLITFLVLVTLYISIRFEWKMAIGALAALVHDLLVTAGLYALVGFVVTPATVIALLTVLGYSLYDTVVVYDKIAENESLSTGGRKSYATIVNDAINQVLMRSINTSLSTMLPIGSLLFVGVLIFKADTLKDLALAMFIGTIVGTYSSVFVASPLLAWLKEKEPRYRMIRERTAELAVETPTSAPARSEESPAPATAEDGGSTPAPQRPRRPPRPRPSGRPRPRKRKRGKRRR